MHTLEIVFEYYVPVYWVDPQQYWVHFTESRACLMLKALQVSSMAQREKLSTNSGFYMILEGGWINPK